MQSGQTASSSYTLGLELQRRVDAWGDKQMLKIEDVDVRAKAAEAACLAGYGDLVRASRWCWYSLEDSGSVLGEG